MAEETKEKAAAKRSPATKKATTKTTEKKATAKAAEKKPAAKATEKKAAEKKPAVKATEKKAAEKKPTAKATEKKATEKKPVEKVEAVKEEKVAEKPAAKVEEVKEVEEVIAEVKEVKKPEPAVFDWDEFESDEVDGYSATERTELNKMYESTLTQIEEKSLVQGSVIAITKKEVVININYKSEGVVPKNEFRYNSDLAIGDVVDLYIENMEDKTGQLVVSHKTARTHLAWIRVNDVLGSG